MQVLENNGENPTPTVLEQKKESESNNVYILDAEKESNSNSSKIVERCNYKNTMFTLITVNDESEENTFITVGKYRMTDKLTKEKCIEMIENRDWLLIAGIIEITAELIEKEKTKNN